MPTSSPELTALWSKRERVADALARCQESLVALKEYLHSLTVEHLEISKLENVMESYDSAGEKLDTRKSELTEQLGLIDADIALEQARIVAPNGSQQLQMKAAIGVFAQAAGDVEIVLIYGAHRLPLYSGNAQYIPAVPWASWTPLYDLRVDTTAKEHSVTLIYKAAIKQNTGEVCYRVLSIIFC
jgi:hypothetical protein